MLETTTARPTLLLIVAWAVGGVPLATDRVGCRTDSRPAGMEVAPSADVPAAIRSLAELVHLLGAQIERRTTLLESLATQPDRFDADDRAAIADSAFEESMLARDLAIMLTDSQASIPELCDAFEQKLPAVERREMDAWATLRRTAVGNRAVLRAVHGSDAAIPPSGTGRDLTRTLLGPGWRRFAVSHPALGEGMPDPGPPDELATSRGEGERTTELFEAL